MNITAMSDGNLVAMIGNYIKQTRLNQNKSQAKLAEEAGINRASLIKIEKGNAACSTLTLIQLLRALKSIDLLNVFIQETIISPIQLAKIEHAKRIRASKQQASKQKPKSDW
jgi:putative transcriptional regulator